MGDPRIPVAESRMYLRSRVRKRRGHDEIMELHYEWEMEEAERTNEENMRRLLGVYVVSCHIAKSCSIKTLITMIY